MNRHLVRAVAMALIIGSILNLINQWDNLLSWQFQAIDYIKMALTTSVPFFVSLASSQMASWSIRQDQSVQKVLDQVEQGNLNPNIEVDHRSILATVVFQLSRHLKNLRQHLSTFFGMTYDIAVVSGKIRSHSKDLSGQVDAISRNNNVVSEMLGELETASNTIESIFSDAQEIDSIVESNVASANEVRTHLSEISKLIEIQQKHCREIEEFSRSIKDISFQSKMLSFNASVEAARAGDAGRGFAVVAEEINQLARQSGVFTSEITEKVTRLMKSIGELVVLSEQAVEKNTLNHEKTLDVTHKVREQSKSVTSAKSTIDNCMQTAEQIDSNLKSLEDCALATSRIVECLESESVQLQEEARVLREKIKFYKGVLVSQPRDVLEYNIRNNIPLIRGLLQEQGVVCEFRIHGLKKDHSKTPADVYQKLTNCYNMMRPHFDLPDLPTIEGIEIQPSDVFRLSNEINHRIASRVRTEAPLPEAVQWFEEYSGREKVGPQDVFMCISVVHGWLDELENKAARAS